MVGAVTLDADHVLQFYQLFEQLFKAVVGIDAEPDAALRAGADGHAEEAFHVERPAREQTTDVRHDPRMVVDCEFQHHLWAVGSGQFLRLRHER